MDARTKRKIKKICDEWKYKYKFIPGADKFIVYGKPCMHHDKLSRGEYQRVSEFFLSEFFPLNYYAVNVLYADNKLEVTLRRLVLIKENNVA